MASRTADPQRSTVWLRRLPLALPLIPAMLAVVFAVVAFDLAMTIGGEPGKLLLWWAGYAVIVAVAFPSLVWWRSRAWVTATLAGVVIAAGLSLVLEVMRRLPEGQEDVGSVFMPTHPPEEWALIMPFVGRGVFLVAAFVAVVVVVLTLRSRPFLGLWIALGWTLVTTVVFMVMDDRVIAAMLSGEPERSMGAELVALGGSLLLVMAYIAIGAGFAWAALRRPVLRSPPLA